MITLLRTDVSSGIGDLKSDIYRLNDGNELGIVFIKHASLLLQYKGLNIYVDPVMLYADYSKMPKADLILVTHSHYDHLDPKAIGYIRTQNTLVIANEESAGMLGFGHVLTNGERFSFNALVEVIAVPAYNISPDHLQYHPKGRDNGYVLDIEGSKIYISGDTEDIAEMSLLHNIDVAFISINQPYTMTPHEAVHAVEMIKPLYLYPYHLTDTNMSILKQLLLNEKDVHVIYHDMQ